jgi:hypothetical protein
MVDLFRQACYPDGFPPDAVEEELLLAFDSWTRRQIKAGNETVRELQKQMMVECHADRMDAALSSPESKALGWRTVMRPNADGTVTQLWTKRGKKGSPPAGDAKGPEWN